MTRMHAVILLACLALPLLCGFSHTCSGDSMKDMMQLSMTVAGGTLGHAGRAKVPRKKKPPTSKDPQ